MCQFIEPAGNSGGAMLLEGSPTVGDKQLESELVQLDTKEKMTYTEQAAKRQHCLRLTRL